MRVRQVSVVYSKAIEDDLLPASKGDVNRPRAGSTLKLLRRVHIYTRTRTTYAGPRRMRTNAKKLLVQRLPRKQTSKRSAGYLLAARMSVRSHQYDCERIFLRSTDSRQIAFACSPNIRYISEWRQMLFAYTFTLCISHAFSHSCSFHIRFAFTYRCGRGFKHFNTWVTIGFPVMVPFGSEFTPDTTAHIFHCSWRILHGGAVLLLVLPQYILPVLFQFPGISQWLGTPGKTISLQEWQFIICWCIAQTQCYPPHHPIYLPLIQTLFIK